MCHSDANKQQDHIRQTRKLLLIKILFATLCYDPLRLVVSPLQDQ